MKESGDIYKDYYDLKQKYAECQKAMHDILSHIICVGGPLNDNALNYSKEQLIKFVRIKSIAESVTETEEL